MTQMQELLQKFIDAQVIAAEANRMAVLAADANEKAVRENTREVQALSQALLLHNTKQEPFEVLVKKHEIVLYGSEVRPGYLQRFDVIEEKVISTLKNISAAAWVLIATLLTGLGAWLIQTFMIGANK